VAERLSVPSGPPPRYSPLGISPLSKVIFQRTEGWQSDRALLTERDHDLGCSNQEFSVQVEKFWEKRENYFYFISRKKNWK
jgi:hypothetical protein